MHRSHDVYQVYEMLLSLQQPSHRFGDLITIRHSIVNIAFFSNQSRN